MSSSEVMQMAAERKTVIDHRFGFPVVLENVPVKVLRGHPVVDVNANVLRDAVLSVLIRKPTRLTGSELRFIRFSLEMSKAAFGRACGVTHPAVIKWENREEEPTGMGLGTEFLVRVLAFEALPQAAAMRTIPGVDAKALSVLRAVTEPGPPGVTVTERRPPGSAAECRADNLS